MSAEAYSQNSTRRLTVRDLAERNDGFGTVSGVKADAVWEAACEDLDKEVSELADEFGQRVSESHVRKVLKELPPEAFGI